MNELEINRKNWWILIPILAVIISILLYRFYDRAAEVKRIEPYVANLQNEDAYLVAESLLEIRKAELYAEDYIDKIISLLGDEREVPEEITKRPDYNIAIPIPSWLKGMKEIYIGDLAAAALIAIGSPASGGLLYSESHKQIKIQRRISKALEKVFRDGTSEQKKDAIRVINITRVEENLPVIASLLQDEDPEVRSSALGLYISYAPLFDISLDIYNIGNMAKHDEDEAVRFMANKVLAIVNKSNR
ncbi:MAG: hypothetical protein JW927_06650 [Deltaproteobacteria bacterium]|nr:hypothetical protein [Deltaproteobacteria bacterium]